MRKHRGKGLKRIFSAFMMLMFVCALFMIDAQAKGNVTDEAYGFSFSDYSPYNGWVTAKRAKQDYTSSYMKCTYVSKTNYSYTAWVVAADNSEFGIDVGSKKYVFLAGSERWMVNYVKEKGYSYARIEGMPNQNGYYKVSGVWSPDSV